MVWLLDDFDNPQRLNDIRWTAAQCKRNIERVGAMGIDCDWTPARHILAARNPLEGATLRWLARRFEAIGMDVEYADASRMGYPASATLTFDVVNVNPYKLVRGLRDQLLACGVTFYENTPVTRIEQSEHGMRITAADGATLIAEKCVLAANAYSRFIDVGADTDSSQTYHTYLLATEPLSDDLLTRLGATPFADPTPSFVYSRIYHRRLLFGGIDRRSENTPADDRHQPSYEKLYGWMLKRFPFLDGVQVEAAWGGAVQQTRTDAPIVRHASDNLILNIGYGGGSGIGMALLSGGLVTHLLTRNSDQNAARLCGLYVSSRFPLMGPGRAAVGVLSNWLRPTG
jgi:sarcosine oxidase